MSLPTGQGRGHVACWTELVNVRHGAARFRRVPLVSTERRTGGTRAAAVARAAVGVWFVTLPGLSWFAAFAGKLPWQSTRIVRLYRYTRTIMTTLDRGY